MSETNIFIIDGTKVQIVPSDLDRDGKVGGIEKISKLRDVINAKDSTELGDALTDLNRDEITEDRLSSVDFRSRIDPFEMTPMVALDALIGMGVLPVRAGVLNRVKMRKSVSLKGQGRQEQVDVIVGKRESDKEPMAQRMRNFMTGGGER